MSSSNCFLCFNNAVSMAFVSLDPCLGVIIFVRYEVDNLPCFETSSPVAWNPSISTIQRSAEGSFLINRIASSGLENVFRVPLRCFAVIMVLLVWLWFRLKSFWFDRRINHYRTIWMMISRERIDVCKNPVLSRYYMDIIRHIIKLCNDCRRFPSLPIVCDMIEISPVMRKTWVSISSVPDSPPCQCFDAERSG